ncbi:putative GPI transamidase component Gpi16 [Hortaea werneckii]|nr:putative GPI transamidase component Gpi16 [Hortaea werneckii]
MKLTSLLALPATLLSAVFAAPEYSEHLHLQPLPNGYLYAGFNFTATTSLDAYQKQHFRYFPRSLGQILQHSHAEELHLRFAVGRWDDEEWGARPRDGRREGGTGVEIWAWVDGSEKGNPHSDLVVEERWSSLVNSLSGLFCASLNFIDGTKTTRPVLSFEPEGPLKQGGGRKQLLHGTLPHEVVCTENLTPFLKLLPCKGKAGISSLLDGHKVFDANWQTMSVDVRPICSAHDGSCELEIVQTVDMVLDVERSMRPGHDPIPRPRPIEEINCDTDREHHGHDTCYPKPREGEAGWSLSKIFGQPIRGSCHLDDAAEQWDISLEVPSERTVESPDSASHQTQDDTLRLYTLPENKDFDLTLPSQILSSSKDLPSPSLFASRQITGYGAERGGMHTVLRNPHPHPQQITYMESLPWFLRPYMHTLRLSATGPQNPEQKTLIKPEKMFYTPLVDRERGTHLELLLTVPAESSIELTYDFEKAVLRYTEYPPDANRGFDVAPAVIRVLPRGGYDAALREGHNDADPQGQYLRTTSLLLPLPTPDFSMPYNVIILSSTVIALGFGSVFNLLVRRFVLVDEVPVPLLAQKVKAGVMKLKGFMSERVKGGKVDAGQVKGGKAGGVDVGVDGTKGG